MPTPSTINLSERSNRGTVTSDEAVTSTAIPSGKSFVNDQTQASLPKPIETDREEYLQDHSF
jgi:hypothetical protein